MRNLSTVGRIDGALGTRAEEGRHAARRVSDLATPDPTSYAAAKVLRRMYFTRSASVCQSIGSIKKSVAPRTNPRSSEAASSTPVAIRIGIDLVAP